MKLIKPSFEIWDQEAGLFGVYEQIERAGRVCYKSEDKIAEGSAQKFVNRMRASGHGAMLEHGTVYLKFNNAMPNLHKLVSKYEHDKYSVLKYHEFKGDTSNRGLTFTEWYITTNYRVLVENDWLDDLQYICEPTEYHEKRVTVKFICDRGVSHEFVRHRVFSFAQESTRYCNYSKDKFGNELTFISPLWTSDLQTGQSLEAKDICGNVSEVLFKGQLYDAEQSYLTLLKMGWKPQQARAVLPNSLKTELVMTGTIEQWKGFFKLRDAGSAHPQAYELANPLHKEFIKRGYVTI